MYSQSFDNTNNCQKNYLNHTCSSSKRIKQKSKKYPLLAWLFLRTDSKHIRNLEQQNKNFTSREITIKDKRSNSNSIRRSSERSGYKSYSSRKSYYSENYSDPCDLFNHRDDNYMPLNSFNHRD